MAFLRIPKTTAIKQATYVNTNQLGVRVSNTKHSRSQINRLQTLLPTVGHKILRKGEADVISKIFKLLIS